MEYNTSTSDNMILRKLQNLKNRIKFIVKYKNKFDFAASFATYSLASSFMARVASKNTALWGHADYLTLFDNDEQKVKNFFEQIKYKKFSKLFLFQKKEKSLL